MCICLRLEINSQATKAKKKNSKNLKICQNQQKRKKHEKKTLLSSPLRKCTHMSHMLSMTAPPGMRDSKPSLALKEQWLGGGSPCTAVGGDEVVGRPLGEVGQGGPGVQKVVPHRQQDPAVILGRPQGLPDTLPFVA